MKGILFRPEVWQAKLKVNGEAQTRRLDGLKEINKEPDNYYNPFSHFDGTWGFHYKDCTAKIVYAKPPYQVGEVVYVKEAIHRFGIEYASYSRDCTPVMFMQSTNRFHWRWLGYKLSAIFLPTWAARYFLKITGVRAERLQEITPHDCILEGIIEEYGDGLALRDKFESLWDSINPKYPWAINPWVWVYSFEKV